MASTIIKILMKKIVRQKQPSYPPNGWHKAAYIHKNRGKYQASHEKERDQAQQDAAASYQKLQYPGVDACCCGVKDKFCYLKDPRYSAF